MVTSVTVLKNRLTRSDSRPGFATSRNSQKLLLPLDWHRARPGTILDHFSGANLQPAQSRRRDLRVVQALDHAAGNQLSRPKLVEDQFTVLT
jgi:hypothetical protein